MAEMAAGRKVHAEQSLVPQRLTDLPPLLERQLVPVCRRQLLGTFHAAGLHERGNFDLRPQDSPERHQVGIGTAVRLGIRVRRAEELFGTLVGQIFNRVDVVAPRIEPVMGNPLGIFIGEQVRHGALRRQRRKVLAGDHLDVAALVGKLGDNGPRRFGCNLAHTFEIGQIGQETGCDALEIMVLEIQFDQGIRHEGARLK